MKNKVQRHFSLFKTNKLLLLGAITVLVCSSNALAQNNGNKLVSDNFDFAKRQMVHMLENIPQGEAKMPHSINGKGNTSCRSIYWWTSGFFPGILWYINEYTGDKAFESFAKKWTEKLEPVKTFKGNHDIGFMMYCSFGNAYRLTQNEKYKDILIQSAYSLATRFNPQVGTIKSWDSWRSWENKHVFKYPVIIDNMMNLELLFWASKATGDPSFRNIAISHAEKAMKYQIRKDGSSYHLACYDPETGNFIKGETSQGYSNESTWSRGQGWGIYGFTLCYRETKDPRFLKTAQRMADYYINHPNLPSDKIPWWDFDTHRPGFIPGKFSKTNKYIQNYRDASAASVTASALLELSSYVKDDKKKIYTETALQILTSLSSPEYRAEEGKNGNFILKHSTGAIPHGSEVDVPLIYADYYFLEALLRYNRMINNKPIL